jgi:hypothetical protein
VKAIPICTLMHVAIARGTVDEIITPKFDCDYAVNDLICFREFDECSNRFTRATPVMARIVGVRGHGFVISFALLDFSLLVDLSCNLQTN